MHHHQNGISLDLITNPLQNEEVEQLRQQVSMESQQVLADSLVSPAAAMADIGYYYRLNSHLANTLSIGLKILTTSQQSGCHKFEGIWSGKFMLVGFGFLRCLHAVYSLRDGV